MTPNKRIEHVTKKPRRPLKKGKKRKEIVQETRVKHAPQSETGVGGGVGKRRKKKREQDDSNEKKGKTKKGVQS